jgi:hypothetical protein
MRRCPTVAARRLNLERRALTLIALNLIGRNVSDARRPRGLRDRLQQVCRHQDINAHDVRSIIGLDRYFDPNDVCMYWYREDLSQPIFSGSA